MAYVRSEDLYPPPNLQGNLMAKVLGPSPADVVEFKVIGPGGFSTYLRRMTFSFPGRNRAVLFSEFSECPCEWHLRFLAYRCGRKDIYDQPGLHLCGGSASRFCSHDSGGQHLHRDHHADPELGECRSGKRTG